MRKFILFLFLASGFAITPLPSQAQSNELQPWEKQARNVTITRDDWGIAHVHGRTDADAVFGMIYAQAEDDFNRVEMNYINSMGRAAETEGEPAIWRDLRMKMFIDPADMKAKYESSPPWLKALMDAWADGLNFYLANHREVKPKVITYFEPWMALTFSEGSIGGDIESINLNQLQTFYGKPDIASLSGESHKELAAANEERDPNIDRDGGTNLHRRSHATRPHHPSARRQVGEHRAYAGPGEGPDAIVHAHESAQLQRVSPDHGTAYEFFEQHDLR